MIKLPRGNSAKYTLSLTNADGTPYVPSDGDIVIFTIKKAKNKESKALVSKKIIMPAELVIELEPADTIGLAEGDYYYDVGICVGGAGFYTAVICDDFCLLPALGDMEMI